VAELPRAERRSERVTPFLHYDQHVVYRVVVLKPKNKQNSGMYAKNASNSEIATTYN
jgi:hypothetical protein